MIANVCCEDAVWHGLGAFSETIVFEAGGSCGWVTGRSSSSLFTDAEWKVGLVAGEGSIQVKGPGWLAYVAVINARDRIALSRPSFPFFYIRGFGVVREFTIYHSPPHR